MTRMLCVFLTIGLMFSLGCASTGQNNSWQDNVAKYQSDIFLFSKLATRVALVEAKPQDKDIAIIRAYLVTARDLLSVPGKPNFEGAKQLVSSQLPEKYRIYGLTVIDVIQRYVASLDVTVSQNQTLVTNLVVAGINGAIEAVDEFTGI